MESVSEGKNREGDERKMEEKSVRARQKLSRAQKYPKYYKLLSIINSL